MVLLKNGEPVACEANSMRAKSGVSVVERRMRMALWVYHLLEGWIDTHNIKELNVLIETPILNRSERGVTTMMSQMRMLASYEAVLYDLPDTCKVYLGEVHNQTAKASFTGTGNADKPHVISKSVWAYRPDILPREHLADAQAIGGVTPSLLLMNCENILPKPPTYTDHAIGKGPKWKGKHPRERLQ